VIEAVSVEAPELGEGEVLVEVLAAPINPSDVLTLTGDYGTLPPPLPLAVMKAWAVLPSLS